MSADNYIVIRKVGCAWCAGMGFMSTCPPEELPDEKLNRGPYATLAEAEEACEGEYVEYGVQVDRGENIAIDRDSLDELLYAYGELIAEREWWKDDPRCGHQSWWDDATKRFMRVAWLLGEEDGRACVKWVKDMKERK